MLTGKIADPGVVIDEMSAFPPGVTPVASALPSFLAGSENAPVPAAPAEPTSTSDAAPQDSTSGDEVNEGSVSPSSK